MTDAAELWDHVLEAPDDRGRLAVLGDHLQAEGDPRGPLVALQMAPDSRAVRDAEDRYRFEHREALLGPLARSEHPSRVVWRDGFVAELELVVRGFGDDEAQMLAELAGRGALALVRRLRLVGSANYDRVVGQLLRTDWPLLHTLHLGPMSIGAGRLDLPLQYLFDHLPGLRDLRVEFPGELGAFEHAGLERLTLSAHAHQLWELSLDRLPALRAVRLFSREEPEGPVLDGALARRLSEVGLHGGLIGAWLLSPSLPAPDTLMLYDSLQRHRDLIDLQSQRLRGTKVVYPGSRSADRDKLLTPPEQSRVRRFERSDRFWEILRNGPVLTMRYGKLGRNGTRRQNTLHSAYQAASNYRERVQAKRDEGFVEVYVPLP
ncbi:MAG: WGR domain-containing protein [Myxococcota bacterium]